MKVPLAIGVVILLGLAMSACAGNTGGEATCQPGVCAGSTPASTPDRIGAFEAR